MSTTEHYGGIKLVDFPFSVGRAVRVKRNFSKENHPDAPYRGRKGIVAGISVYPNGRIGVEVEVSIGGRVGRVWREYDPSELELA